jgi:hypothetical protein
MHYVPHDLRERVEQCLNEHRKAREVLDEITSINLELLKRRERF